MDPGVTNLTVGHRPRNLRLRSPSNASPVSGRCVGQRPWSTREIGPSLPEVSRCREALAHHEVPNPAVAVTDPRALHKGRASLGGLRCGGFRSTRSGSHSRTTWSQRQRWNRSGVRSFGSWKSRVQHASDVRADRAHVNTMRLRSVAFHEQPMQFRCDSPVAQARLPRCRSPKRPTFCNH